jgi:formamidopyrimidine-DNA glycosylase
MPELPEVETVVRTLAPKIVSQRIDGVRKVRADIVDPVGVDLASVVRGRTITRLYRRAKRIVFELDDGNRFYIHLGMTGRLTLEERNAPLRVHTHLILKIEGRELRFVDPRRFGGVFWLGREKSVEEGLGPEPLGLDAGELGERLRKTRRAIKTALLDQKLIAGVGNIYADEALFTAQIDPRKIASRLSGEQVGRLSRAIKTVLTRAIEHRGSTLRDYRDGNGEPGEFQKVHQVYDREGEKCLVCGGRISRIVLGGRSTYFCGRCQGRGRVRGLTKADRT